MSTLTATTPSSLTSKKTTKTTQQQSSKQKQQHHLIAKSTSSSSTPSKQQQQQQRKSTAPAENAASTPPVVNHEYCNYCKEGGDLLNCDRCPISFHLVCHEPPLDLNDIPKGEFLCQQCKLKAAMAPTTSITTSTIPSTEEPPPPKASAAPSRNDHRSIEFELLDDEQPIDTLIRMAKSLNPREMLLSADVELKCAFDVASVLHSKIKWWSRPADDVHRMVNIVNTNNNTNIPVTTTAAETTNGGGGDSAPASVQPADEVPTTETPNADETLMMIQQSEETTSAVAAPPQPQQQQQLSRICFMCQRNARAGPMVRCDYCSLLYHLDCLNPPLTTKPSRDRMWMCPNHIEHFLDQNLLNSTRVSDRVKLWNEFSNRKKLDGNAIKVEFLKKCQQDKQQLQLFEDESPPPSEASTVKKCKIPDSIQSMYSSHENEQEEEEQQVEMKNEEVEEEVVTTVRPPPLNKKCTEAIRSRAFLQHIPSNVVSQVTATSTEEAPPPTYQLPAPVPVVHRCTSLGSSCQTSDICLDVLCGGGSCANVSSKHACIYYDESTQHYELLNYSEHGTVVDNCLYGFDLRPRATSSDDEDDSESEAAGDSDDDFVRCERMMSSKSAHRQQPKCQCSSLSSSSKCKSYWEGPAILSHGSHIRMGCVDFVFIVVDPEDDETETAEAKTADEQLLQYFSKEECQALCKQYQQQQPKSVITSNGGGSSRKKSKLKKSSSSNGKKTNGRQNGKKSANADKIDAFIKLMNNKDKRRLLNPTNALFLAKQTWYTSSS